MPLPQAHLLDELATAYVQAVAAVAGATIAVTRLDYGVDGTLKHIVSTEEERFIESGFPVDFQVKGTTSASIHEAQVVFDLRVRNYELITTRPLSGTPYYLFLVCFGSDRESWIVQEHAQLILSASAYWWTESNGMTENMSSVRIRIPLVNRLTSGAIEDMLVASEQRFLK